MSQRKKVDILFVDFTKFSAEKKQSLSQFSSGQLDFAIAVTEKQAQLVLQLRKKLRNIYPFVYNQSLKNC